MNTIVIRPTHGWGSFHPGEVWRQRELLYFLVWRDVKARYSQTVAGVLWAVLQPAMTMLMFSLVFGRLAHMPSEGVPYPVFVISALVPWIFFSSGVNRAAHSLVASQSLIKKVYFPRLFVPLAAVLSGISDLIFSLAFLFCILLFFGISPRSGWLMLPALIGLAVLIAFGIGLWLSALNVRYRDVQHVLPFVLQVWLFATPVAYPRSLVAEPWRLLYDLNPMVGVIEGFRWALLGPPGLPLSLLGSLLIAVVVCVSGLLFFHREARVFADVV